MARDDEDEARGRHAAHVSRNAHPKGGGHRAPNLLMRPNAQRLTNRAAQKIANGQARGLIATHAANPRNWQSWNPDEYDDEDDIQMVHPLYVGLKFKEYEYQEYPKWVEGVIVNDEAEEARVLEGKRLIREPEERERMLAICDVQKIQVDKRWANDKIRRAIIAAGADPDFDPRV